jgi:hypothetical protein
MTKASAPIDLWDIRYSDGQSRRVVRRPLIDRKEDNMCYTCGCGNPDDNMGDPRNITNKTFEEAAKAAGEKPEEAKRNALKLLKKILKEGK